MKDWEMEGDEKKETKHWYFDEERKTEGLITPLDNETYYITLVDCIFNRMIDGRLSKYSRNILWFFGKQLAEKAGIYIIKKNYRLF